MTLREELSFLLTNRVPRRWLTLLMGRLSPIEAPLVSSAAIGSGRLFSDLDLSEARKSRFTSLQDCFIRELKPGARPIAADPATLVSPCDAIVGACGTIDRGTVLQAKGFPYTLTELLTDASLAQVYEGGQYVTLRITPTMYHRFHAPHDLDVEHVTYVSGDTWNVYPIALRRVQRLFCRNERAILRCRLASTGTPIALVPVAAILVASIRLHCADVLLHLEVSRAERDSVQRAVCRRDRRWAGSSTAPRSSRWCRRTCRWLTALRGTTDPYGGAAVSRDDMNVGAWWAILCAVAAINITAWTWPPRRVDHHAGRLQLVLSGIYVFGCAFRSCLPRLRHPAPRPGGLVGVERSASAARSRRSPNSPSLPNGRCTCMRANSRGFAPCRSRSCRSS